MAWWKVLLIVLACVIVGGAGIAWLVINFYEVDPYVPMFADNCASCHGEDLRGTEQGVALVDVELVHGDSVVELAHSIRHAHGALGSPAFSTELTDVEVKGLAIYVGERRMGQTFTDFKFAEPIRVPDEVQSSAVADFRVEKVIDGLEKVIFSIEPLPNGEILLSEKERGLSIISAGGEQSALIEGTPETGGSMDIMGIQYGSGWLLDVATHPDYENNGWIYLHYTHICGESCDEAVMAATMNRVDRGRIRDGQWVDVETIWQSDEKFYEQTPDTGAGGRLAFDDEGNVYLSVGIKSTDGTSDTTAQDLDKPYGKIHRVRDDGSIPLDNPFALDEDPVKRTIWTYGHRSPQGLEWHPIRRSVWNSEMGPRGGDELNELKAGKNYGWPYYSLGLEYSTDTVERHKLKDIEFDNTEVEQTLVDITPSPAISSFVFYQGEAFPSWQEDVLIGSLKGQSLFRMEFDGDQLISQETLIKGMGRIRDVEVGYDGCVYLLLEAEEGSAIVRLVPA